MSTLSEGIHKYIHEMMEEIHQSLTNVMKMRNSNCFSLIYYYAFEVFYGV